MKLLFTKLVNVCNIVILGGLSGATFYFLFVDVLINLGFNVTVVFHDTTLDTTHDSGIHQVNIRNTMCQVNIL